MEMKHTQLLPYKEGSLLFAPMEGVTDPVYREMLSAFYSEWDYFFSDFYRIPTQGEMKDKSLIAHYGEEFYQNPNRAKKCGLQVLTSAKAKNEQSAELIQNLGFKHLDLNLGCPSKKVNAHQGGAFLLSDLSLLEKVIKQIRNHYHNTFTVKIRTGFKDTSKFEDIIHLLCDQGVDAITIHGRTRDEGYKGFANWKHIQRAVEISSVPIIGNGDVWNCEDIKALFEQTGCYAVMCGRGALKTPWLARNYKEMIEHENNEAFMLEQRKHYIFEYYNELDFLYRKKKSLDDTFLLKRFKGLSRYLFDDFEQSEMIRSKVLRSQSLDSFYKTLNSLSQYY